jgi:hypothetical protein
VSFIAEPLFGFGAATETPCAADEFGGGDFFDGADGQEFVPEAVAEVVVFFLFLGWTQLLVAKRPNL